MAITEKYLDVDLATGLNDGTSEANAWQTWADAVAGLSAGERLNVKNPSSRKDISGSAVFTVDANNTTPIHVRGYGSTIGDGTPALMENFRLQVAANWVVEAIDILNSDADGQPCFEGNDFGAAFYNCKGVKTGAGSQADGTIFECANNSVVNCYAEVNTTGASNWITSSNTALINCENGVTAYSVCVFKGDPMSTAEIFGGIRLGADFEHAAVSHRNVVYWEDDDTPSFNVSGIICQGLSVSDSGGYHIHYNTIHNFATGIRIDDAGGSSTSGTPSYSNNLITACPWAVRVADTGPPIHFFFNTATDGNFSGAYDIDTRLLTADPYTDKANADFSLNTAVGGGEACRARAVNATGGTPDVGAIQA